MKKIIKSLIFSLIFTFTLITSFAQKGSYISMTSLDNWSKITISVSNDIAYYTREDASPDPMIGHRVYNTTNLPFDGGRIEIPLMGRFWYIPFDNSSPVVLRDIAWCYSCLTVGNCDGGSCYWLPSGGSSECKCNIGGGGSSCEVQRCPCGSEFKIKGSGIIIEASNVIQR